jgi:hypothetical protein
MPTIKVVDQNGNITTSRGEVFIFELKEKGKSHTAVIEFEKLLNYIKEQPGYIGKDIEVNTDKPKDNQQKHSRIGV